MLAYTVKAGVFNLEVAEKLRFYAVVESRCLEERYEDVCVLHQPGSKGKKRAGKGYMCLSFDFVYAAVKCGTHPRLGRLRERGE